MSFNSFEFLIFFPIVVLIYFLLPKKLKQFWLLFASYYFDMSWNAKYALLILTSTVITYASGILLEKAKGMSIPADAVKRRKKWIVALSFCSNLGILFFFKYMGFFTENINKIPHIHIKAINLSLPLGISFYTFQILTYSVDVYRRTAKPQKNIINLATYITLFPQLIAGPIVRYRDIAHQLNNRKETLDMFTMGVKRFTIGLAKKV